MATKKTRTRYLVIKGEWCPGPESGVSDPERYYETGEIVALDKNSEAVKWARTEGIITATAKKAK